MKLVSWLCLWWCCSVQAVSLYSRWPDGQWVDLFQLSEPRQHQLALHLALDKAQTLLWLQQLEAGLLSAACDSTVPARMMTVAGQSLLLKNWQGLLHIQPVQGEDWWFAPWSLLAVLPDPVGTKPAVWVGDGQQLVVAQADGLTLLTWQPDLTLSVGWQQAIPMPTQLWLTSHQLFVASTDQLQMRQVSSGELISSLSFRAEVQWLGPDHLAQQQGDARLLLATANGQIWQLNYASGHTLQPSLLAEISQLIGYQVQQVQHLVAAVPIEPGVARHLRQRRELLLLSASTDRHSVLLMTRLSADKNSGFELYRQNADRVSESEQSQLLQADGWLAEFDSPLFGPFLLAAGVWYQQLDLSDPLFCLEQPNQPALLALHLHYGTAVYPKRLTRLEQPARQLKVTLNSPGFQLMDAWSGRAVLTDLLEIKPQCAACSSVLLTQQFPRQKVVASYLKEQGGAP